MRMKGVSFEALDMAMGSAVGKAGRSMSGIGTVTKWMEVGFGLITILKLTIWEIGNLVNPKA